MFFFNVHFMRLIRKILVLIVDICVHTFRSFGNDNNTYSVCVISTCLNSLRIFSALSHPTYSVRFQNINKQTNKNRKIIIIPPQFVNIFFSSRIHTHTYISFFLKLLLKYHYNDLHVHIQITYIYNSIISEYANSFLNCAAEYVRQVLWVDKMHSTQRIIL